MFKLSKYNICLPLEDNAGYWLLLNGCSGRSAIVDGQTAQTVIAAEKNMQTLQTLPNETMDQLRELGCLIPVSAREEDTVDMLCNRIHGDSCNKLNISFIPGYACNFSCPYCFEKSIQTEAPQWYGAQMSESLADAIFASLDKLLAQGKQINNFTLFGGEPLLPQNKQIIHYILERCKAYGSPILVVTNGYYLDTYLELLEQYPIDTLKITIDGTEQIHDSRRAPKSGKSFRRILSNVRAALEKGIAVSLRTNINRENFDCISSLRAYYQEQGLTDYPHFSYYFKATMSCFEPEGNAVSDVQIMESIGSSACNYCLNSAFNRLYIPLRKMLNKTASACFKAEYCGAHSGNMVFDPFGRIYSCWDVLTDPRSVIGTVDTEANEFVWNENCKVWQSRTVNRISGCAGCKYKLLCGGGCAAQAMVTQDRMDVSFCEDFIERFHRIAAEIALEQIASQNKA